MLTQAWTTPDFWCGIREDVAELLDIPLDDPDVEPEDRCEVVRMVPVEEDDDIW